MMFVRDYNPADIRIVKTKKSFAVNYHGNRIEAQLGDDDMPEAVVPKREPGWHDGRVSKLQKDDPSNTPTIFVSVPNAATAEVFRTIDRLLPDYMEQHGLGNEYRREEYRPLFNIREGDDTGCVSVKMNLKGTDAQAPVMIKFVEEDEDGEIIDDPDKQKDADVLDIVPGKVDKLYLMVTVSSVWKVKGWGVTLWANYIGIRKPAPRKVVFGRRSAAAEGAAPPRVRSEGEDGDAVNAGDQDSAPAEPVAAPVAAGASGAEDDGEGGAAAAGEAERVSGDEEDEEEEEVATRSPTPPPSPEKKKKRASSSKHKKEKSSSSSKRRRTEEPDDEDDDE